MKYKDYGDPPTVEEVIKELKKMPKNAKCFVRLKYKGTAHWAEDVPLNHAGIAETPNVNGEESVTFLV